jgi:hypothetical protein
MRKDDDRMGSGWKAAVAVTLAIILLVPSGCRRKEASQQTGDGEPINLNALSQIENYKEILKKDPNNLQALINIGNLYFDTRQDHQAMNVPESPGRTPERERPDRHGGLHPQNGNPDRAVEELKKRSRWIRGTRSPDIIWESSSSTIKTTPKGVSGPGRGFSKTSRTIPTATP